MTARELASDVFEVMFVDNNYNKAIKLIERYYVAKVRKEAKTVPLAMLLSIAGVSEPAITETTTEFCARIAARYGYKVEDTP